MKIVMVIFNGYVVEEELDSGNEDNECSRSDMQMKFLLKMLMKFQSVCRTIRLHQRHHQHDTT